MQMANMEYSLVHPTANELFETFAVGLYFVGLLLFSIADMRLGVITFIQFA